MTGKIKDKPSIDSDALQDSNKFLLDTGSNYKVISALELKTFCGGGTGDTGGTYSLPAGEIISQYNLVSVESSTNKIVQADYTLGANRFCIGIALLGGYVGDTINFQLYGTISGDFLSSFTVGSIVYLGSNGGLESSVTAVGTIIQPVGYILPSNTMIFKPDLTYITNQ